MPRCPISGDANDDVDVFVLLTAASGTESTGGETVGDSDGSERNPLLLTGVCVCVLVVLLSIAFVCYRQWRSRQLASKLVLTSTPTHEALLAGSEQANKSRTRNRQQRTSSKADDSSDHSQRQALFCL